jgi:hypothetical protein
LAQIEEPVLTWKVPAGQSEQANDACIENVPAAQKPLQTEVACAGETP